MKNENAIQTSKRLTKEERMLTSISSEAANWATLEVAKIKENQEKLTVVILPDTGERYLTNLLD